jgi:hypothetical protein
VSNQVEIIYSSSRNSKETGEIIRISPRKSARGIRPLRWGLSRILKYDDEKFDENNISYFLFSILKLSE